ncbi:MAG: cell entry (mce) related family protein [Ilumatobacteraceae bacterium]|nr:cell entry (mce) related family protein [Ilumatobacteraceae bacterium]
MSDEVDFHAFNRGVVQEFRATGGQVTGDFAGWPLVLITHRGAKSGREYTTPLVYTRDGDKVVIIASKGGAPDDPQWFRNLQANPDVTVEVGAESYAARARVAEGDERDRLYRAQADQMPNFDEYAAKTSRAIPVVVLERA